MKFKYSISLIAFSVTACLFVSTAPNASASVSLSQAKSLIRALYYGQQQAYQRGVDAENAYEVAHLYPGMYSSAKACLISMESQMGGTYGPAVPDLTTLDKDPSWAVPTGLPKNKLSGRVPRGDTFVLDVKWDNGLSTNHVTILNGKAYYYLWVCGS